nr:hypothetical protein RVX_2080 [Nitratidesulfovibrio sp. HK-II]
MQDGTGQARGRSAVAAAKGMAADYPEPAAPAVTGVTSSEMGAGCAVSP